MSRDHRSDCRIYVRNLPPNTTDKDIEELFSKFGKISSIDLKSRSRQPSAFVEFEDSSHAVDAVHSRDGYQCDGHTLKVEFQRIKDRPTISSTNSGNSRSRTANGDKAPANSNCHSNVRHSGQNSWLTSVIRLLRIDTIYFATLELFYQLSRLTRWVLCHTRTCAALVLVAAIAGSVSCLDGPHQRYLSLVQKQLWWCVYWCGLGILSSVGFGTGLHTFLLYLGPHIASVTLAAYECDSLDFPSPPYPDEIICPVPSPGVVATVGAVNIWSIMAKVRLEAFMWGAGTALGELPPYFVARAHRLAGEGEEDLDPEMAEEIVTGEHSGGSTPEKPLAQRMRAYMIRLVTKVGFFGILACASIPNPLFDLAGITCGYSLVPFWTFFGATLIGKAVIKMHIQKLFVIIAFNESYVEVFVQKSRNIPFVGQYLHEPLREFLVKQKKSLHRGSATQAVKESSWLSKIFEWVVISMILYFLVSIVSSMSQNYQKRVQKHRSEEEEAINNSNHLKTQ